CLASPAVTCQSLSSTLPRKVFYPGSDAYNSSINSYTYVNDRLFPACIVGPRSTRDVVSSVNILDKYPSTHFAIRGGGHSFNTNFSNTAGGVTIDMRGINTVTINEGRDTVSVGAGALWRDVYAKTDPRNISVLGGRIATVGVAGLISGGGISFFSPARGWVCDGVANFEIALSSGKLVNANTNSNPELFAALKGGQNNFGIITRFDLKTFAIKRFWGGTIAYTNSTDDAILAAFTKSKTPKNYDPEMSIVQNMAYDSSTGSFNGITALYYTTGEANPKQLKFYTDIKPQLSNTMRLGKPGDFAQELEDFGVPDEQVRTFLELYK
ncbi:FAD-binding domain-containing protein, partial [Bimuria novae-zelandiae CBS 107.79]